MNKQDKENIGRIIEEINRMFPYRLALVYNAKVNRIVNLLELLRSENKEKTK